MFVSFFPSTAGIRSFSGPVGNPHDRPLVHNRLSAGGVAGVSHTSFRRQDCRRCCVLVAAIFVVLSLFCRGRRAVRIDLSPPFYPWSRWSILWLGAVSSTSYFQVQVSVAINDWYGPFYDLVQAALSKSAPVSLPQFYLQLATFAEIAFVAVTVGVVTRFFVSHYIFRWRTAMNDYYVAHWPQLRTVEGASERVQEDAMRFANFNGRSGRQSRRRRHDPDCFSAGTGQTFGQRDRIASDRCNFLSAGCRRVTLGDVWNGVSGRDWNTSTGSGISQSTCGSGLPEGELVFGEERPWLRRAAHAD